MNQQYKLQNGVSTEVHILTFMLKVKGSCVNNLVVLATVAGSARGYKWLFRWNLPPKILRVGSMWAEIEGRLYSIQYVNDL